LSEHAVHIQVDRVTVNGDRNVLPLGSLLRAHADAAQGARKQERANTTPHRTAPMRVGVSEF
jgi:hypothetical protein